MTVIVRDVRPEDAPAVAAVRQASVPYLVSTAESLLYGLENANPAQRYRLLVAELDGEVIGTAHVGIAYDSRDPGQSATTPHVHPDHRGRGAGGLLLRAAEEHLAAHGATAVYAMAADRPEVRAFAERRGYRPARSAHFQRLDLVNAPLPELPDPLPDGVELRTAADFAADPRPLFLADAEVTADEPSDIATELADFDDWLRHTWRNPLADHELTSVVLVDGEVAAFTIAEVDGRTRYVTGMTGTVRAHRSRGLAKLAKTDSLRRARAAGYTDAFTNNDAGNGPMLAVNEWFGYERCATEVTYVRALG
ncbi:GNAT family N-acetyltransferase [Streptomyces sp. TRM64462]|uniref:GNAT family N-acetyltransferase n=1 Tax=Streptomyces sp. TRM64462 TaxID=2741726 RepID=UPI001586CB11|nr:GNAT family N-acetyltransferase [Streptomyces sp. TRM64462]